MNQPTDWRPLLEAQTKKPYWHDLIAFVNSERAAGKVFPKGEDVFKALHLTPYQDVRVVILGQDPYHNDGQAMGLSFSVPKGEKLPPSLQNIYKELATDLGKTPPTTGDLTHWAQQGVLLLNSVLTVQAHQAASHQGKGWETFTDAILKAVNDKPDHVVFILWGGFARKKKVLIDTSKHTVIESAHPSPLSSYAGFFGSKPFSKTNHALQAHNQKPIYW
ncbi:uracil-DNA glycosylase [bacterium]|nr:uracil-DNA glycosylase [bacterium]NBX98281.1 uracil-DNA glycosylase [bacterium]NDC95205.1 uracil-DNA glycosylase [bacterium]NDD84362.1 uracil-DNA glycosylase [bacterium]